MAFERPTLKQIIARVLSDIASNLTGADSRLRRSFERAIGIVLGGAAHLLHGHLVYLSKQILADTSDEEMLLREAALHLDPARKDPEKATGEITMTGVNGTSVPALTQWSASNGALYETDILGVVAAGVLVVASTAVDAGALGNIDTASPLSIGSPIAGLDSEATVTSSDGMTGGTDLETVDEVRSRLLLHYQKPPSGGGPGDYESWCRDIAGVTRAWANRNYGGAGNVGIFFVRDSESPITPSAAEILDVQTYIDTKAPLTAVPTVRAPTLTTVAMTIAVSPNTAAVQAAVEAQLEAMFLRDSEPGLTIYPSQLSEAISLSTDEDYHVLTVPAAAVTHANSELPILGTITWV